MLRAQLLHAIRQRRAHLGKLRPKKRLPRQVHPSAIEAGYAKDARALIRRVAAIYREQLFPLLRHWLSRTDALHLDDEASEALKAARAAAAKAFAQMELEDLAHKYAERTQVYQRGQLEKQLRGAVGVDVFAESPKTQARVEAFVRQNVSLIRSIPERLAGDVEYRVLDAVNRGTRVEDLASELEERFDVSESRAELIARDQVNKLYGQLQEDRQTELGIESYVWRTAMDERVRPEHADREGDSFRWDDPPEDGAPGEPVLCRCYGEPVMDELIEELTG